MSKKKLAAIISVVASVAVIGGAFAYFSATAETKENKFAVVVGEEDEEGGIEIEEPKWNEPTEPVLPGQLLPKDPDTLSKVEYDGYCIMKVTSPKIMATIGDETEFSAHEAFKFIGLNVGEGKDFIELKKEDTDKAVIYYYGFKNVLEAGKATTKLFTAIQLNDFTSISENQEGMVDKKMDGQVDIDAALVQKINPESGYDFGATVDANGNVTSLDPVAGVQAAWVALGENIDDAKL